MVENNYIEYLQSRIDRSELPGDYIVNSLIKRFAPEEYTKLLIASEFSLLTPESKLKIDQDAAILWGKEVRAKEMATFEDIDKFTKDLIDNKPKKFKKVKRKDWRKMVGMLTFAYWPKIYGDVTNKV